MNAKYIGYAVLAVVILFGCYTLYNYVTDDRDIKSQLLEIKKQRDSLRLFVDSLDMRTKKRDLELQKAIDSNLKIINELNTIIEKRKIDIAGIHVRIDKNTSLLDSLWKAN